MGAGYEATCNKCGAEFQANYGGGMSSLLLHCDRCGKEAWWDRLKLIDPEATPDPYDCKCGGSFTLEADPRCPKCRSGDLEIDRSSEILYD